MPAPTPWPPPVPASRAASFASSSRKDAPLASSASWACRSRSSMALPRSLWNAESLCSSASFASTTAHCCCCISICDCQRTVWHSSSFRIMLESSSAETNRDQISSPASCECSGSLLLKANRASRSCIAFWCRASIASISRFMSCSRMLVKRLASFAKASCRSRSSTACAKRLTCVCNICSSAWLSAPEMRAASATSAARAMSFSASDSFMRSTKSLHAAASSRNPSMFSRSRAMRATCSASTAVFSSASCRNKCSESRSSLRKSSACDDIAEPTGWLGEPAGSWRLGDRPARSLSSPTNSPSPVVLTFPLMSLAAWLAMSMPSSSSMALSFGRLFGSRRVPGNATVRAGAGTSGSAISSSLEDCALNNCNLIAARSRPKRAFCSWESRNDSSNIRCSSKSRLESPASPDKRVNSRRAAFNSLCKWDISTSDALSLIKFFCLLPSRSLSAAILSFTDFSSFFLAAANNSSTLFSMTTCASLFLSTELLYSAFKSAASLSCLAVLTSSSACTPASLSLRASRSSCATLAARRLVANWSRRNSLASCSKDNLSNFACNSLKLAWSAKTRSEEPSANACNAASSVPVEDSIAPMVFSKILRLSSLSAASTTLGIKVEAIDVCIIFVFKLAEDPEDVPPTWLLSRLTRLSASLPMAPLPCSEEAVVQPAWFWEAAL
mmetsp:Transcript_86347/g.249357  ORF Transcript_86347/g.249357 Transcript_86347/m.249357 type:complete len:672 (+) Transcript_86347:947-2962(+)